MSGDRFDIRMGTPDDMETLVSHRLRMFYEIRPDRDIYLEGYEKVTGDWIANKVKDSNFVSFIAETKDGKIAGSGCILIKEDQPRPEKLVLKVPYLLSMFTEPEYRSQGVASLIIKESIRWARENGYDRMDLHGSPMGKSLYEKFGFRQTNEMRLML